MEIVSYVESRYYGHNFAVIKVSQQELNQICGDGKKDIKPENGAKLDLAKSYIHAMVMLRQAETNKDLPNQLRAFATALETTHPAIAQVVDPPAVEQPAQA